MAVCQDYGREIRDDIWTCGFYGAPVAQRSAAGRSDGLEWRSRTVAGAPAR